MVRLHTQEGKEILFNNLQAYLLKKLIYGESSSMINARGKPIKLSDDQIGKLLFKIRKNFLKKMKKPNHKRSIDKFGYIKIKNFYSSKNTKKNGRQENIFLIKLSKD